MGCVTSLGLDVDSTYKALKQGDCHIQNVDAWSKIEGLNSHVAAFVPKFDARELIPRKQRRTMSKMSEMACQASFEALTQAGLWGEIAGRKVMIIFGSTTGSPVVYAETLRQFHKSDSAVGQHSTSVFKCMSSSAAVNLAAFLKFEGPVISPAAACSTSSQAAILGMQFIRSGFADIVIAGGCDECHETSCMTFDASYAASRNFNSTPQKASRPFDKDRDGIVTSEGASVVVLESEASLSARKNESYGIIKGGSYQTQASHMSQPSVESIQSTILQSLKDAQVEAREVKYVNAHATSTQLGDKSEAEAVFNVFDGTAISSLKGHFGHTFAACGGIEMILSLLMLRDKQLIGTLNLDERDSALPALNYLSEQESIDGNYILSNNFAFGGMNTSMVLSL